MNIVTYLLNGYSSANLTLISCDSDFLVHGLRGAYQSGTFTGALEQFRPDALPAATTDSYGISES